MADDNKDDAQEGLKKLLEKHNNDAMALAGQLYSENYQLRDKSCTLRAEVEDAKKKLPAEDAVILSKADAERLEAYKALGKPDDLRAALTERDTLKTENAKAQRKDLLRSVADAEGFDVDVFTSLASDDLSFEIKEVKKDGKEFKQASVIIKVGDKQESKPLADYAAEKWQKFLPALKPTEKKEGTPYVPQKKADPPKEPDRVADERKKLISRGDYQL